MATSSILKSSDLINYSFFISVLIMKTIMARYVDAKMTKMDCREAETISLSNKKVPNMEWCQCYKNEIHS